MGYKNVLFEVNKLCLIQNIIVLFRLIPKASIKLIISFTENEPISLKNYEFDMLNYALGF